MSKRCLILNAVFVAIMGVAVSAQDAGNLVKARLKRAPVVLRVFVVPTVMQGRGDGDLRRLPSVIDQQQTGLVQNILETAVRCRARLPVLAGESSTVETIEGLGLFKGRDLVDEVGGDQSKGIDGQAL